MPSPLPAELLTATVEMTALIELPFHSLMSFDPASFVQVCERLSGFVRSVNPCGGPRRHSVPQLCGTVRSVSTCINTTWSTGRQTTVKASSQAQRIVGDEVALVVNALLCGSQVRECSVSQSPAWSRSGSAVGIAARSSTRGSDRIDWCIRTGAAVSADLLWRGFGLCGIRPAGKQALLNNPPQWMRSGAAAFAGNRCCKAGRFAAQTGFRHSSFAGRQ